MYATERQELTRRLLADEGRVSVIDLSERFDVSTETIRRDLDRLEETGLLRRVHGGAVAPERISTAEPSLAERTVRSGAAKSAIARRALDALGEGFRGSVFFDAGTTTGAVAALFASGAVDRGIEVVTHALTVGNALAAGGDDVRLTVIGGRVRGRTAAAVGAETVRAVQGMRPDVAFVGTNGISADFGLSTPDPDEAAVKTAIVGAARRVVVVADADKHERELLVGFAPLSDIDVLVTDAQPPAALSTALADAGVQVWLP